ncbi:hypothetical protein A9Z40_12835 [Microbacterium arborescens]|uniref:Uncharacterized protein n=1 Tax=Microbacterium arborescens TaxID=33883 RepID=A0ABX2WM47_9MICO|nr:putative nucleotide-diphospho-sugar transferase [Microbacterium arborescens]OAZ44270.1 hypothetical protein A9Z40_12835 [Microbacterium arborescens]
MAKLIYTIAQNGYGRAFASCIRSQRRYAARVGAEYVVIEKPNFVSHPALSAWLKIPVMLHALEAGFDEVAYIDADCEVKEDAPDFADPLRASGEDVMMALGRSGRVNSGVMFARSSAASIGFFGRVRESLTEEIPDDARANLKYENGNVIYVAETAGGIGVLPVEWNNTVDPSLRDYVRHYSGPMSGHYKRNVMDSAFYWLIKKTIARRPRQPAKREQSFADSLDQLVGDVHSAYPALVRG